MVSLERDLFFLLLWIWIASAFVLLPVLLNITAPYGRHSVKHWGPRVANKIGWLSMELPVILVFSAFFFLGDGTKNLPVIVMYSLFILHYINRVFIFPFQLRDRNKKMPLVIVVLAIVFNFINGFFNGHWLGSLAPQYDQTWLSDFRFIIGSIVFFAGMFINIYSDQKLIGLRKGGKTGYFIPDGWLFKYISSPNLFGEILEWTGWALLCWNLPALSFAIWTMTNLIPRALDHHRWYKQYFDNYPDDRKAVIPFLL
jgi:hypothetical protein